MVWMWLGMGCVDLPQVCGDNTGARRLVNRFWGTLDAEYAVFDARETEDWGTVGEQACVAVAGDPDDDVVFDALLGMARSLDDGHIQLEGAGRDEDGWVDVWPHYAEHEAVRRAAEAHFGSLQTRWRGAAAWGRAEGVGYLSLYRLDEFTSSGAEGADRGAFVTVLDEVFEDLEGVDAWVIDLRFNEGGWDQLGLDLAGRFTDERYVAWRTQQRDGPSHGDLTEPEPTWVEADRRFVGPVRVLTAGGTFSAGETLVLAMRAQPDVQVVGERTSGHLSDMYDGRLPKQGWSFSYSGDRYTTPSGAYFEGVGIEPDVEVAWDVDELAGGVDGILEAALASLK